MVEPEPTPTGCSFTFLVNLLAGFFLYFAGLNSADVPTAYPAVQIQLAPQQSAELAPIIEVLERRLIALGIEGATVRAQAEIILVEIPSASLPAEVIAQTLAQPGLLQLTDYNEAADEPLDTILTNEGIGAAKPILDSVGNWAVEITFTEEGQAIIGTFTENHLEEKLGFVLDGQLLIAPTIYTPIRDLALISGTFSEMEVRRLAAQIESGAFEVPLLVLNIDQG